MRPRVLVVGGGFGGLRVVRGLRDADVDVVLVDKANHHLFQPLLYQVSTALLPPGDIAAPLRRIFSRQRNVTVVMGEAVDVDVTAKTVRVETIAGDAESLSYDYLVAAVGAVPNYFGNDDWAASAPPMKSIDDAIRLRDRILRAFEVAAATDDAADRRRHLTFAVVGAGPTGVELAGQLAAMGQRLLRRQFTDLQATEFRIVLADAGPEVLPPFPASSRQHVREKLQDLGVELLLGREVTAVDSAGMTLAPPQSSAPDQADGEGRDGSDVVPAATVIWAAGVKPAPFTGRLAAATGAQTDRKGRLCVLEDCSVEGHPEIFALGDMVNLDDLPGIAEPAIQEGRHVAKTIAARVRQEPDPGKFHYVDLGTMATISPLDAVAEVRSFTLAGLPAKVAWGAVHLGFLVGWGHRAAVLSSWAWVLATGRRQQQVILSEAGDRAPS